MKKMHNYLFTIIVFGSAICTQTIFAQSTDPFTFEASYIGDIAQNVHGGIKTGSQYLGLTNIKVHFNTTSGNLWDGGEFLLNVANTHGGTPSASMVGDFQHFSNIEAGNLSYVHELWYNQSIGNFNVTFGVQDLNALFVISENGTCFINSSFGVPSTISNNTPVPIFPLTAPGISVQWHANESLTLQTAIYDGCPTDFAQNPYNLKWKLNSSDGLLSISELQLQHELFNSLHGTYKMGTYYHSHLKELNENNELTTVFNINFGFYFLADQVIIPKENDLGELNAFTQISVSPGSINNHYLYTGCGLVYKGLFSTTDNLGIAFAGTFFNDGTPDESVVELNYKRFITERIFVQPDIQYVMHPAGEQIQTDNALVATLRFGFNF